MFTAMLIVLFVAFLLGFVQSFLVGLYAKTWDGGTGFLWGSIIALISLLAAIWLQWQSIWIAIALSVLIGLMSGIQVYLDKRRSNRK